MSIVYRPFRNNDVPALVRVWNGACTGRGAALIPGPNHWERYIGSRVYFDPQGLILAESQGQVVGFVHAGFAPAERFGTLDTQRGVLCALVVDPAWRRQGIGSGLLLQAETYLQQRGARTVCAGCIRPESPFYWGLHGGSEPAGVLDSDSFLAAFLVRRGYEVQDTVLVYEKRIEQPGPRDARTLTLAKQYRLEVTIADSTGQWFEEQIRAPMDVFQALLVSVQRGEAVAGLCFWEMDLYALRSHTPQVGLFDVWVREAYRHQGLGKLLLVEVLRYLHEQFYALAEVHVAADNTAGLALAQSLGFAKVERGRRFLKRLA